MTSPPNGPRTHNSQTPCAGETLDIQHVGSSPAWSKLRATCSLPTIFAGYPGHFAHTDCNTRRGAGAHRASAWRRSTPSGESSTSTWARGAAPTSGSTSSSALAGIWAITGVVAWMAMGRPMICVASLVLSPCPVEFGRFRPGIDPAIDGNRPDRSHCWGGTPRELPGGGSDRSSIDQAFVPQR